MDALYYKSFMQCQLHSAERKKCLEQVVNAIIQSENGIIALSAL
jgi:deoxycytidylate deaminase